MSINRSEFNAQCVNFVLNCRGSNERWALFLESFGQIKDLIVDESKLENLNDANVMLAKTDIRVIPPDNQLRTYEYNVIYSDSYEVPVMYFSTSHQDGSPVCLRDILPSSLNLLSEIEFGQVISQVEHPVLFRPFHMIHPCRTRDFMDVHSKFNPRNYLICWLSTVGTFIGLKLDHKLGDLCEQKSLF